MATYIREDMDTHRVREVDWDKEGRVLIVEMQGWCLINVSRISMMGHLLTEL